MYHLDLGVSLPEVPLVECPFPVKVMAIDTDEWIDKPLGPACVFEYVVLRFRVFERASISMNESILTKQIRGSFNKKIEQTPSYIAYNWHAVDNPVVHAQ